MRKRLSGVVVVLCCTALAGCYQKVLDKDGLVVTYEPWVPTLVVLGGLVVLSAGVINFRQGRRMAGIGLGLAGLFVAAAFAPTLYLNSVVVNQGGFYSHRGFWWAPIVDKASFGDLETVRLHVEERSGRRGKTYSFYFDCLFKSGIQERIPLGDLMREALPEIAEQFRQHGVQVEIPPNLPN